jgi:hypothetical protein
LLLVVRRRIEVVVSRPANTQWSSIQSEGKPRSIYEGDFAVARVLYGPKKTFELTLAFEGTDFQKSVTALVRFLMARRFRTKNWPRESEIRKRRAVGAPTARIHPIIVPGHRDGKELA